jgi:UPF0755 protein
VLNLKSRRLLFATGIVIVALVLSLFVIRQARKPEPIPNYQMSERSTVTTIIIPEGASGDQIARILFDQGVVKSSRAFFAAATANPRSQSIQPGTYRIDTKIPGSEAVNQLLDRERRLMVLLIREGERAYELQEDFRTLEFDDDEISRVFNEQVALPGFGTRDLEGFLFPATYNLLPGESIEVVRDRLLAKFSQVIKRLDFLERVKSTNLTPYEALIVASIVQGEGFDERDFGRVARVIFNRLALNMPLQMDSTVLYALRERRIAVSKKDIAISSRYNTYNRRGLPPTPIGNPGASALEATLNPEPGEWLYFVTVAPTETKFTKSYQEFLSFKAEFKRNLKAGLFDEKP